MKSIVLFLKIVSRKVTSSVRQRRLSSANLGEYTRAISKMKEWGYERILRGEKYNENNVTCIKRIGKEYYENIGSDSGFPLKKECIEIYSSYVHRNQFSTSNSILYFTIISSWNWLNICLNRITNS